MQRAIQELKWSKWDLYFDFTPNPPHLHVYLARATVQCVLAEVDLLNIAGRQVKQIKCLESVLL